MSSCVDITRAALVPEGFFALSSKDQLSGSVPVWHNSVVPGYSTKLGAKHFSFGDLREVMAKATPLRSGDVLAGVAAANEKERAAAQRVLAQVPLERFLKELLIPYEEDEVSRLIVDEHDAAAFAVVKGLTVGEFREWLLAYETTDAELQRVARGLTPEMVAAVSKICRNQDLILIAKKCRVVTRYRNTLGLPGRMSVRLQPNHPRDDLEGIAAAILDGLLYGCGDAVIGINPATDNVTTTKALSHMMDGLIREYEIPTQSCVLAHVTTTLKAIEEGTPVDLVFQSIAGTEAANKSFGVDLKMLKEAHDAGVAIARGRSPIENPNVMYFETGQGSALSAGAHHGVDQQTLEARSYAVARKFAPLLVNTVVGFIGPEYLYDGKQIIRAALEDHFCGKLLGLPMGVDVCYTNHAEADQNDMDNLLTLLGAAGVNYIMGVPGADDVMLSYQSTSFHDAQYVRQVLGLRPAPEFEEWLAKMEVMRRDLRLNGIDQRHRLLGHVRAQIAGS
jgi:ethanolamine ammonia-lyase large subunit